MRPPTKRAGVPPGFFFFFLPLLIAQLVLSGCGGGGGGGGTNVPPTAGAACTNTAVNTGSHPGVTGNLPATDPDSATLSYSISAQGSKGTATVMSTGLKTADFSYTPNVGARGVDTFTYQADDLSGGLDTGTVKIVIGDTRIMPLGDSITSGQTDGTDMTPQPVGDRIGFRKRLYDSLVTAGHFVDFVGSVAEGSSAVPPITDPHHEGNDGDEILDVASAVIGFLDANPADIVLLHIGTNDVAPRDSTAVGMILDAIDTWETTNSNPITVFLARIIDQNPPNADVAIFNINVATMADTRILAGDLIVKVDQYSVVTQAQLADDPLGLHPNVSGYNSMADKWLADLTAAAASDPDLLPKCP